MGRGQKNLRENALYHAYSDVLYAKRATSAAMHNHYRHIVVVRLAEGLLGQIIRALDVVDH